MATKIRHLNEQLLSSLILPLLVRLEASEFYTVARLQGSSHSSDLTLRANAYLHTEAYPDPKTSGLQLTRITNLQSRSPKVFAKSCSKDRALRVCEVQKAEADSAIDYVYTNILDRHHKLSLSKTSSIGDAI
jgi:hypothetical protein